jgi:hypothetical protein
MPYTQRGKHRTPTSHLPMAPSTLKSSKVEVFHPTVTQLLNEAREQEEAAEKLKRRKSSPTTDNTRESSSSSPSASASSSSSSSPRRNQHTADTTHIQRTTDNKRRANGDRQGGSRSLSTLLERRMELDFL